MPWYVSLPYVLVALAVSIFYGRWAFDIHVHQMAGEGFKSAPKQAYLWHQRWFNFVGSAVGWFALWKLIPRALADAPSYSLCWGTAATAVVALLGITGYLPLTLFTFAAYGAEKLREKAAPKIQGHE